MHNAASCLVYRVDGLQVHAGPTQLLLHAFAYEASINLGYSDDAAEAQEFSARRVLPRAGPFSSWQSRQKQLENSSLRKCAQSNAVTIF